MKAASGAAGTSGSTGDSGIEKCEKPMGAMAVVEPQLDERLPEELTARERDNRELQRLIARHDAEGSGGTP